jgi:hypothetical protein
MLPETHEMSSAKLQVINKRFFLFQVGLTCDFAEALETDEV